MDPKWDAVSWATLFVNPTIGTVKALQSDHKLCELSRLGASAGVIAAVVLPMKHYVVGVRPCAGFSGCVDDGMPSGHTAFSAVGGSSWSWGITLVGFTGGARHEANRHTKTQTVAGALIGLGGELTSKLIHCGT